MNLWICRNCLSDPNENGVSVVGYPFAADLPVCPKCGIDGREAEYRPYVIERLPVHLDPPHAVLKDRGKGVTACDGTRIGGRDAKGNTVMGTGLREAVTCPACRETEVFLSD
ncbi:MAG: hypothetical protein VKJ09_15600, partial [Leptolyngbya sp.]|nr:hypothetical protein [Leptolyngbya sp.]